LAPEPRPALRPRPEWTYVGDGPGIQTRAVSRDCIAGARLSRSGDTNIYQQARWKADEARRQDAAAHRRLMSRSRSKPNPERLALKDEQERQERLARESFDLGFLELTASVPYSAHTLKNIAPDKALVVEEVATIDRRGRFHILTRWTKRLTWFPSKSQEVEALMVFKEPGLVSISDWYPDGERIEARYKELSGDPDSGDALRLIQDRYQKLVITYERRPSLGDATLLHLGYAVHARAEHSIYVAVYPDRIELLSPAYRDEKLMRGHPPGSAQRCSAGAHWPCGCR
jgi:hypothetical protein